MLEQLGYGSSTITFKQRSLKVKVNADVCISCGNCVFYCPYHAAKLGEPGVVTFDLAKCRGCGLCVAMCPALALDLENWERDRITELIAQYASEVQSPGVLAFRCQWSVFPPLNGDTSPNVRYIDLPCSSRVDKYHLVAAFNKGFKGIVVSACTEDDCKQEKASAKAKELAKALEQQDKKDLKKAAKSLGLTASTSLPITRDGSIPSLGPLKDVDPKTFQIPVGGIGGPVQKGDGEVIYQIEWRGPPKEEELAPQKDQIQAQLLNEKRRAAFDIFQDSLKSKLIASGRLKINKEALAQVAGAGSKR